MSIQFQDYDEALKKFEIVQDLIKPGKCPALTIAVGSDRLSSNSGTRVLLVDEWIGTGAQIRAAIKLMEQAGAIISGIAVLYIFPDEPANLEIVRKYETFTANCLVCNHFECRCQSVEQDEQV